MDSDVCIALMATAHRAGNFELLRNQFNWCVTYSILIY